MILIATIDVDDALIEACRLAYGKRMVAARALEVIARADRSKVTLQQWYDAKNEAEEAYYAWSAADAAMRRDAAPARNALLAQFDRRIADLPKPAEHDKIVPDDVRVELDMQAAAEEGKGARRGE